MAGPLLLSAVGAWIAFINIVATKASANFSNPRKQKVGRLAMLLVLIPLPVVDEVVGGWQFTRICEEHSAIKVDHKRIQGATIYFTRSDEIPVKGTLVPVAIRTWEHVYEPSGDKALEYETLRAKGGVLVRKLALSEDGGPVLFRGYCGPKEKLVALKKTMNVTVGDKQ